MSEQLRDFVFEMLEKKSSPLWLAFLGSNIPPDLMPEGRLGEELEMIEGLTLARDPERPQRIAVCREEDKDDVERVIRGESVPASEVVPQWYKRIYYSIIAAFTVETADNEDVYIKNAKPYKYLRLPKGGEGGNDNILIPSSLRRPGADYKEDGVLYSNIQQWAQQNGIPFDALLRPSAKVVTAGDFDSEAANALSRLIALQQRDVRDKLLIPADIAEILMKYK